jgi:hypothetical protein
MIRFTINLNSVTLVAQLASAAENGLIFGGFSVRGVILCIFFLHVLRNSFACTVACLLSSPNPELQDYLLRNMIKPCNYSQGDFQGDFQVPLIQQSRTPGLLIT